MQLFPLPDQTIAGVSEALQAGRRTCVDVVEGCLTQIDELEPHVHAWVHVDREGALSRARELDADAAAGRRQGPLHGIPVGIKDIVDVAGWTTAVGSELMSQQEPATEDAALVAGLRAAGAVILGKTVTTHFACYDPPLTRNPWNAEHTPGGSSSGSAAAVASGMCFAAIGSQTGGSITRPSAFCGVAGCKPTLGRVSVHGVFPVAPCLDHPGPIARSVRDLAVMLDAIAGHDPRDPNSANQPSPDIGSRLNAEPLSAAKIGRLRGFFESLADQSARDAMDQTLSRLSAAGASIAEPSLPKSFDDLHRSHFAIMSASAAAYHERRLAEHSDDYLPCFRTFLEEGLRVSAAEYVRSRQHQAQTRQEILACFEGVDVLACPAALGPAPDTSTTGDPAFNSPWSYTGLPTVSFPIGLSANGLPLAIQLVGRPFAEADLFRAAAWCEDVIQREHTAGEGNETVGVRQS